MNKLFAKPLRSGLVAIGLLAGLATTPALAGPMPQTLPAAPSAAADVIHVRDSWAGGNNRNRGTVWRRHGGDWHGRDHWRGRDRWRHDDWRRHHYRRYYGGSGVYFGLGVLPSYNYYASPRRYYRGGSAHVRWCYNRYRSYRAWDNSCSLTTDHAGSADRPIEAADDRRARRFNVRCPFPFGPMICGVAH